MTSTKSSRIAHQRASSAPTVILPVLRAHTQPPTQFARPRGLRVQGATDQSGTPYVEFVNRDISPFIPLADVHSNTARAVLEGHNIILTKAEWDNLRADIDKLTHFPPRLLAKRPGWTGSCHVLPNGIVIAPPGTEPAVPLFEPTGAKCRAAGASNEWKRGVKRLVEKATLPTFAVMIPFASALLEVVGDVGNFGIEFTGSDSSQRDSLHWLAASVVGRPNGATSHRYALAGTTPPTELLSSLTKR